MAYPVRYFLTRRVLVAGALAALASPALANIGPELLQGTLAKFQLAKQPKPLPELAFNDANDKPLKLSDYKGKIVLLNFWRPGVHPAGRRCRASTGCRPKGARTSSSCCHFRSIARWGRRWR